MGNVQLGQNSSQIINNTYSQEARHSQATINVLCEKNIPSDLFLADWLGERVAELKQR